MWELYSLIIAGHGTFSLHHVSFCRRSTLHNFEGSMEFVKSITTFESFDRKATSPSLLTK